MTLTILVVVAKVIATWLAVDFISGCFHWLEDTYGNPFWPLVGRHVTKPNILHHYIPRAFVTNSWYLSSRLLILICSLVVVASLALGAFNWMVALAAVIGANANHIHKSSHRTRHENGPFVVLLQRMKLIQSPSHHHRHHTHGKNSNYCVLTDFLNPILDGIGFWRGLEWIIEHTIGVKPRNDEAAALAVLAREPEFFGANLELVRERVRRGAPGPR